MSTDVLKNISDKYCARFGQVAVEMGFITETQLKDAVCCQIDEELSGQGHRLLGAVLFSKEWMTSDQIELVLNTLLKRMRNENEGPEIK
jgi:hypothetical protein